LAPSRNPSFEERVWPIIGSEVATFPAGSIPYGEVPRTVRRETSPYWGGALAGARLPRHPSHMTIEEVEDVLRALTAVAEKLETGVAKQSMQEAFMQVCAHAGETRAPREKDNSGNDRLKRSIEPQQCSRRGLAKADRYLRQKTDVGAEVAACLPSPNLA